MAGENGSLAHSTQSVPNDGPDSPLRVLFVCRDGATKSVLAAAYFERLALERGLTVRTAAVGIDPRPRVDPAVARHLTAQGYLVPVEKPRQATIQDVSTAGVLVSIGSDLRRLRPRGAFKDWNGVPDVRTDFDAAVQAIRLRVAELVEELTAAQPRF